MLLEISDRIAVMKAGRIVELDTAENLYFEPTSSYTRRLLGSFPSLTGETGDFVRAGFGEADPPAGGDDAGRTALPEDRKSTRLNSSHVAISYAVFCLNKKTSTHLHLTR